MSRTLDQCFRRPPWILGRKSFGRGDTFEDTRRDVRYTLNDSFLVSTRLVDTLTDDDERRHLFGTIRLLNTIAAFAADGGLRESASWISVRQHIYTSLTSQHPFTINLTHYRDSSAFSESTDESWANRIIFIFASILTHVFRPENEPAAPGRLEELGEEVEAWSMSKPWNFAPLWEGEARDERGKTWPWPEMLMSHPAQSTRCTIAVHQFFCDTTC